MAFEYEKINTEITPTEFEKLVQSFLLNTGKELNSFKATHDVNIEAKDGTYQIDVYAEFIFLNAQFKILIECKRHKSNIKRDIVQLLHGKLIATGSQKGMIFSTSGFQSGAIKYAEIHGIALIRVIEGKYTFMTKSANSPELPSELPDWMGIPKYIGEYRIGNTISFLQEKNMKKFNEFLFGKK